MLLPALVALTCSTTLGLVGSPAASPRAWVAGLVLWGLSVAWLLPRGEAGRVLAGRDLLRLALVAGTLRLPMLAVDPTLSDDLYRFCWEGRAWLAGFSPFAHAPDSPALAHLRDELWSRVNHRELSSIYPPGAQLLFVLVASHGIATWRWFVTLCDIGTAVVLARRDHVAGWAWALLPLPAVEAATGGHLEGVAMLALAFALVDQSTLGAWLGAMVKLLPGVLLLRQRPGTILAAAVAAGLAFVPLLETGFTRGFEAYRAHWSFNGSVYPALVGLGVPGDRARVCLQGAGLIVAGLALWRCRDPVRLCLWVFGAFVLLSPTVHPWYALWPLLPALLLRRWAWVGLAALVPLAYLVLATLDPATGQWREQSWVRWAIYLPFFASLARELPWRR